MAHTRITVWIGAGYAYWAKALAWFQKQVKR